MWVFSILKLTLWIPLNRYRNPFYDNPSYFCKEMHIPIIQKNGTPYTVKLLSMSSKLYRYALFPILRGVTGRLAIWQFGYPEKNKKRLLAYEVFSYCPSIMYMSRSAG